MGFVFVVDDDSSVRRALVRLLESAGHEVEALPGAREFLAAWRSRPGCLVLDVQMPGTSGPELHDLLRELEPALPVVFITGHGTIPMGIRAMKNGAVDFLPKPFDDAELLDAVERALERDRAQREAGSRRARLESLAATLTEREREVFGLVADGSSNKAIAGRLGIAEKTVKVHRGRVMQKMQADSLAELVRQAEELRACSSI